MECVSSAPALDSCDCNPIKACTVPSPDAQELVQHNLRDDGQRQEGKAGGSRAGPHVASRAGVGNTATSLHTAKTDGKTLVFGRVIGRFTTASQFFFINRVFSLLDAHNG